MKQIDIERAALLAQEGLKDEEIIRQLGISRSTFYRNKRTDPSFAEALKQGRDCSDTAVERALFRKATGYVQKIQKPVKLKEILYENGKKVSETEHLELVEEEQYFPPDTASAQFWLKNRCPKQWNKQEKEEPNPLEHLAPEQALSVLRRAVSELPSVLKEEADGA